MTYLGGWFWFVRTGLYLQRFMAMDHRRYIAWYHSTTRVVFETWRAADCRPYGNVPRFLADEAIFNGVSVAVIEGGAFFQAGAQLYKGAVGNAGLDFRQAG